MILVAHILDLLDVFGRLPGLDARSVHCVDFFECRALGLVDAEVDKEERKEHTTRENICILVANVVGDHGSEKRNAKVPEPQGTGTKGHTLGTNTLREDLGNNNKGKRSPGRGKSQDIQTGEKDHGTTNGGTDWAVGVIVIGVESKRTHGGEN